MANKIVIATILTGLFVMATSIYGIVISFSASILIGIGALIIQPCPFVFGCCSYFGYNIPQILQQWLNLPI